MRERQRLLKRVAHGSSTRLVYPVVLKGRIEDFPPEAQDTQCRDMRKWNSSVGPFSQCPAYVEFQHQVAATALDLVSLLRSVPDWQPNWPVVDNPKPPALVPPDVPRL
jgi:hypothetical protein